MKKLIITILIIGTAIAAYFLLRDYYRKENVTLWDFVPENAIVVYETDNPVNIWRDFLDLPIWNNLSTIPEIKDLNDDLVGIDTLTRTEGGLEGLFRDRKLLISLHKISNTKMDAVIYLPINTIQKRKILNSILTYYMEENNSSDDIRIFEGFNIHELRFKESQTAFSFIEHKDYFIGSFTSFLVEDVIRNITSGFKRNFSSQVPEIFENKPIEFDEGNVYIDISGIPDLIRTFSNPSIQSGAFKQYGSLAKSSYYDLSFESNRIFFNGSSSVPPEGDQYFLGTFYNQESQSVEIVDLLPNFTAAYLGFTCDDFKLWRQEVDNYWEHQDSVLLKQKIDMLQKYDILENELYRWMGNEIGVATLRSINIDNPDKLIFIKAENIERGMSHLDDITLHVNHANEDTLLFEEYSDRSIKKLNIEEFPARVFGSDFLGFEASYYTSFEDYIVIGNSFDVIKVMLNDVEDQNTWGKSLKFVQFFDNIQKRSNMTYIINFSNAWNSFFNSLNSNWKDFFEKYDHQFKHFEYFSVQFSNINNHFYTSMAIQHRQQTSVIETPARFFKEQVVVTDYPIITKPFVVRSHLDRSLEVMLQDSANYLYLISSEGEILWKDSIGANIVGDIHQVDFYKNNKLQYFFATGKGLHIIDRNGDYISGFPVYFADSIDLQWVNLIDYDNSKRYRYLLGDSEGNIFLFDKYGELLDGWDPLRFEGAFSTNPFHLRIGGRDCMINIQAEGQINAMTRRADFYDGFPVKVEGEISGPVFIQKGADFKNTLIHVVNSKGELIKINLNGSSIDKKQLYRSSPESHFEIVPDVLNNTYMVARQDYNNFSIISPEGEVTFDRELLFSDRLKIQYYNFSAGNEIYAVTDSEQSFTYIFDGTGFLINTQPVESSFEVGLIFSESNNNYKLYSCYGNQFSISSFYRR